MVTFMPKECLWIAIVKMELTIIITGIKRNDKGKILEISFDSNRKKLVKRKDIVIRSKSKHKINIVLLVFDKLSNLFKK